jgi:23S rRNA (pseudouridine1915-N3)-methyltransferase
LKLLVVAVGSRMPAWIDAGFEEYARRMPREAQVNLVEVKPEPRAENDAGSVARLVEAEAKRIAQAIPRDAFKVVLDERGRTCTTRELAQRMAGWQME